MNADYDTNVVPRSFLPLNDPRNEARHMAMYMIRQNTFYTFDWIDRYFTYTNSHSAVPRFEQRIQKEKALWMRYERLQQIFINKLKDSKNERFTPWQ